MSKHTPGPWRVESHSDVSSRLNISAGHVIATVGVDTSLTDAFSAEQRANARLIAAAPELLEALRCLKHEIEFMRTTGAITGGSFDALAELEGALEKARTALSKATGICPT